MTGRIELPGVPLALDIPATLFEGATRVLDEAGSTNDLVADLASKGAPEGVCIIARRQTRGRGRERRPWESAPGGLYLSALLRPREGTGRSTRMSIVAGLAVCRAVQGLGAVEARIKWPNDVIARGSKLAGILCEARLSGERVEFIVCGIGVNVSQAPRELPPGAATVSTEAGRDVTVDACAREVLRFLDRLYGQWMDGAFDGVQREYAAQGAGIYGARVEIAEAGERLAGVTRGLDTNGLLRVALRDGSVHTCLAGDVSFLDPGIKGWPARAGHRENHR